MTGWTNDEYEVECPMPDCTNQIDLLFDALVSLGPEDLLNDTSVPMSDASAFGWRVECRAGHVILLPTEDTSCGCEDEAVPADDHEHWFEAEEYREFNGRDMARLRAIITTIDGAR